MDEVTEKREEKEAEEQSQGELTSFPWEGEWPMKALGWMYAQACIQADAGKDIRQTEVPALLEQFHGDMREGHPNFQVEMNTQQLFDAISAAVGGGFAKRQFSAPAVIKIVANIREVMCLSGLGGAEDFGPVLEKQILTAYHMYKQLEVEALNANKH